MQTIVMTIGTSLLTNANREENRESQCPWTGKRTIGDMEGAIAWMTEKTDESLDWMERFSAETNTFWRLDPKAPDELILLHSDTLEGLECAQVLCAYFQQAWGQTAVQLHPLPGVNYESEQSESALEKMAVLLTQLIEQARGIVTLAATGGFKAQTMIMSIVGQFQGIPVCYVHEKYRTLIYLPYLQIGQVQPQRIKSPSPLPTSSRKRSDVVQVQESKKHHRPKTWKKVEKMLQLLPWVESVRYDEKAFAAPQNAVRRSRTLNRDKCYVFWLHLYESEDTKIAVSIETTGYTEDHEDQAFTELREKLSDLLS